MSLVVTSLPSGKLPTQGYPGPSSASGAQRGHRPTLWATPEAPTLLSSRAAMLEKDEGLNLILRGPALRPSQKAFPLFPHCTEALPPVSAALGPAGQLSLPQFHEQSGLQQTS